MKWKMSVNLAKLVQSELKGQVISCSGRYLIEVCEMFIYLFYVVLVRKSALYALIDFAYVTLVPQQYGV